MRAEMQTPNWPRGPRLGELASFVADREIVMFRLSRFSRVGVPLMTAAAFFVASPSARAQVEPFKVTGGGLAYLGPLAAGKPGFHFAVGHATHLGKYYGAGYVQLDEFLSPTTAAFSSAVPFVFQAANGDKLACHYAGVVELTPAGSTWVAEFTLVPEQCTGRFKKAVALSFIMTAVTGPFVFGSPEPVPYIWHGEGAIEFARGK